MTPLGTRANPRRGRARAGCACREAPGTCPALGNFPRYLKEVAGSLQRSLLGGEHEAPPGALFFPVSETSLTTERGHPQGDSGAPAQPRAGVWRGHSAPSPVEARVLNGTRRRGASGAARCGERLGEETSS